ncbi:tRNA (guanine-N(1)-)-methyltransferase [Striga asiatica]|uniref:tRNA (Guanine-N(1)-)-methyltransferase n=1 Tax=Striga asiatica TaxID=4170 RepID=A0A5A7PZW2_STRAF|nr:tRNA (guanine-N(1)-)-methyltransferase [Striga asiatica]
MAGFQTSEEDHHLYPDHSFIHSIEVNDHTTSRIHTTLHDARAHGQHTPKAPSFRLQPIQPQPNLHEIQQPKLLVVPRRRHLPIIVFVLNKRVIGQQKGRLAPRGILPRNNACLIACAYYPFSANKTVESPINREWGVLAGSPVMKIENLASIPLHQVSVERNPLVLRPGIMDLNSGKSLSSSQRGFREGKGGLAQLRLPS